MYNTIIFDLDGLLIDSEIISYQLYQDLLRPYGHSFSLEDYCQNYSGKTALGNMNDIVERFSLPVTIDEGLQFVTKKEKEYIEQGISLKKGAKELLDYLKKHHYQIVLATSSLEERALSILKQHHIENYFDDMVFGKEVKNGKPYPDIFLKACEKVHSQPSHSLVIEDSEAGIQAAYTGHIPVVCIPDMKKPQDEFIAMAQEVLPSLFDVIHYLKVHHTYQMIALDMDGTLLNSQKKITPKCQKIIQEAVSKGKTVVLNTGRCPAELAEYLEELKEIRYLNCISGALIYDCKEQQTIYSQTLDISTVKTLFQIASLENTMVQLLNEDSYVQKNKIEQMSDYGMGVYIPMYKKVTKKVDDLKKEYFQQPFLIEKMNIYHKSSEDREKTREKICEKNLCLEMADAEITSLEISPKNINKGKGLEILCQYLRIPLTDVIVVGDADNDYEALKKAGLAIAMANANERVKKISDIVVSDNDHDGCYEAIEKYLLSFIN